MNTRKNQTMTYCIAPTEIQSGDLLAYVDGAASAQVADHLGRCAACRADAAALAALDVELGAVLFRITCPPTEDLLAYQVNLLGTGEHAQIRLHLHTCLHCQAEVAELAAVPLVAKTESLPARLMGAGKRLLDAVLLMPVAQPALQRRGHELNSLVYQAGPFQIILAKVPPVVAENIWQIEGQLLDAQGPGESNDLAELLNRGEIHVTLLRENPAPTSTPTPVAQDRVDDLGFFLLEGVESGTFVLQIDTPTATIRLADFRIP